MALVAMMKAGTISQTGGEPWERCGPEDEGAVLAADHFKDFVYGVPEWLWDPEDLGPAYIRRAPAGVVSESITLNVVRVAGAAHGQDPNAQFFLASPSGALQMNIENPKAMGYIKPGRQYRVTIEEVRGPRKDNQVENMTAEEAGRAVKITVNNRTFGLGEREMVDERTAELISYEELCRFARKDPATQPTMVWQYGQQGGTLLPGESVNLRDGMAVQVHDTSAA